MERCRARDLGIKIGFFPTGPHNAITDVAGVRVGHATIIEGSGSLVQGTGPVRTGVTAILPSDRIYDKKLIAGGFVLNGAGEIAGLTQLNEWALLETPIGLTNTHAMGSVSKGIIRWMSKKYHRIWDNKDVVIPVIGECDDSFLNDVVGEHVTEDHVIKALKAAATGPVEEGSVGGGTGMICCDLKAGIGTSSRVIEIGGAGYVIGVLVMNNFGLMEELRIDGFPIGRQLAERQGDYKRRRDNYGSIIAVVATDIPLSGAQIQRLCKRAALGIGRAGSHAAHGSGELVIGFSTANGIRIGARSPVHKLNVLGDEFLGPAYRGVIETTEEAIINSLCMAEPMTGSNDHSVPAIDRAFVAEYFSRARSAGLY